MARARQRRRAHRRAAAGRQVGQRAAFVQAPVLRDEYGLAGVGRQLIIERAVDGVDHRLPGQLDAADDVALVRIALADRVRAAGFEFVVEHAPTGALADVERRAVRAVQHVDVMPGRARGKPCFHLRARAGKGRHRPAPHCAKPQSIGRWPAPACNRARMRMVVVT